MTRRLSFTQEADENHQVVHSGDKVLQTKKSDV